MAKSKRRQPAAAKKAPTEPPAVRRALQKLRDFYRGGLAAIDAADGKTRRQLDPKDVVKTFARERGMYPDYIRNAVCTALHAFNNSDLSETSSAACS